MKASWLGLAVAVALITMAVTVRSAVFKFDVNGKPTRWNFTEFNPSFLDPPPDQNPATLAIRYHLAAEGWSATNRNNELDAVRAAFGQWQAVPGSRVKFEEAAMISGVADVNTEDGKNMVLWLKGDQFVNGGTTYFPPLAAGLTVSSLSPDDETIVEADIILNSRLEWFTEFNPDRTSGNSVEAVVLHEIGHLLGLSHSPAGGSTMFWTSPGGVSATAGLASEEEAALRTLYPSGTVPTGTVRGALTLGGAFLAGAVVTAEDGAGRVVASTVSRGTGGIYELGGLTPGPVTLRVTPLDPAGPSGDAYLVRGEELDTTARNEYAGAQTDFLPTTNVSVTVNAGAVTTKNLALKPGKPPFRITETRRSLLADARSSGDICVQLRPGLTNVWVGVYVPVPMGADATLRLTGEGLIYGPTEVIPNALRKMTLVQVEITVTQDAIPGLRSVSLTGSGFTAWANGFAEILPAVYDFNHDGLDDLFQRRYFSPFTRPEAGPEVDPDGDGFINRREAEMGSDPTSAASVNYRLLGVKLTVDGTRITWESAPGKNYQVYSRDRIGGASWQAVGKPVRATAEITQFVDGRVTETMRYYRVGDAP